MSFVKDMFGDISSKRLLLAFQHLFAMFGATVLVPALTGLNPAIALFCAGIGTLLFHFITKRKVPIFLGSSFAFIAALQKVTGFDPSNPSAVDPAKISMAQGGIIVAGLLYAVFALIVYFVGAERVRSFFPPVVTGPVIVVIGLTLSPVGISMAASNWYVAVFTVLVVIGVSIFAKNFFKLVPILIGIVSGYILCVILDLTGVFADPLVNFSVITSAPLFNLPFTFPTFDLQTILLIAPISLVTMMEHIGDITTNGSVVGKDFFKDPGLNRTILGDGIATAFAGLLGGPPNTTYSENTGVLAVTKNYDPSVLRIAAVLAVLISLVGKFAAGLQTIPSAVMGGVSIILFGMIASIGIRTLAEAKLDFSHSRNLIIVAMILVIGLGLGNAVVIAGVQVSGLFLAVIVGAFLNKILPKSL